MVFPGSLSGSKSHQVARTLLNILAELLLLLLLKYERGSKREIFFFLVLIDCNCARKTFQGMKDNKTSQR